MQAVRTINKLQTRAARTPVDHHPNRDYSGICRCGEAYGVDPTTTGTRHTAEKRFRVTPKEATRC
jgi:hypothetical protein